MTTVDVALIALAAAVAVFLAELIGRAIAHVRPEPLRWHDLFTQRREDQMRARSRAGGVDVVAIGASDVNFSVDAKVVEEITGRSCYNASLYRGLPEVTQRWLTDRVLDLLTPTVVVLGMSPVLFNDNSPLLSRVDEYNAAPVFHAGRLRRAHWRLSRHSFALRYAGLVRHPRLLARVLGTVIRRPEGWRWSVPLSIADELDADGRCTTMLDRAYGHGPRMLGLFQQQAGPGFYDRGEQLAVFVGTVRMLRTRGILPVVSVSPTCADLIDGLYVGGRARWEQDLERIKRLVEDAGAAVLDVTAGLDRRESFADMLHTNGAGQAEFSRRLAVALADLLDRPAPVPVTAGHA